MTQETLNTLALSRLSHFTPAGLLELYRRLGSATAVFEHRHHLRDVLPDASPRLCETLAQLDEPMARAEAECAWAEVHGVQVLCMNDADYPQRLRECDDAPLVLFYKGSAPLNCRKVICVVGTRRCTAYGQDLIARFMAELKALCPQVLVVSGLAYGVDIQAHRQALAQGYDTVGVLAHGLDTLYPTAHRSVADRMVRQGGLLTEFFTLTNADKVNFVRRNRIVAGMSDACILVESAAHGGGLITTGIAQSYNRDVFAFPGAVGAPYSEGCNRLIRTNGAALITSAHDFVETMGWTDDNRLLRAQSQGIERQLFPDLSPDEQTIVKTLSLHNDLQINMLATQADLPMARLTPLLFALEMKGVVRLLPGGVYHCIGC